jgi:predicted transcriptional regulator
MLSSYVVILTPAPPLEAAGFFLPFLFHARKRRAHAMRSRPSICVTVFLLSRILDFTYKAFIPMPRAFCEILVETCNARKNLFDAIMGVVYCRTGGKNMRTVLSVSLPENMAAELETIAKAMGRNKSDIVKESLGLFLWETKFRNIKKKLSGKAKAAGVITEEDIFKGVS